MMMPNPPPPFACHLRPSGCKRGDTVATQPLAIKLRS